MSTVSLFPVLSRLAFSRLHAIQSVSPQTPWLEVAVFSFMQIHRRRFRIFVTSCHRTKVLFKKWIWLQWPAVSFARITPVVFFNALRRWLPNYLGDRAVCLSPLNFKQQAGLMIEIHN